MHARWVSGIIAYRARWDSGSLPIAEFTSHFTVNGITRKTTCRSLTNESIFSCQWFSTIVNWFFSLFFYIFLFFLLFLLYVFGVLGVLGVFGFGLGFLIFIYIYIYIFIFFKFIFFCCIERHYIPSYIFVFNSWSDNVSLIWMTDFLRCHVAFLNIFYYCTQTFLLRITSASKIFLNRKKKSITG